MTSTQTQIRRNVQRVGRKDVNFAIAHPAINDLWIILTGILPYVVAVYIGITFRTVIMTCKGYDYTINGMDLLNVALCVMVVITVRFIRSYLNSTERCEIQLWKWLKAKRRKLLIILCSEIEIFLWEKSKFPNTSIEYPINLRSLIVRYLISI